MKGGFLPAVAYVIAVLMVCLTCGAYNLQVNSAVQCRRAPVQRILDGFGYRSLKPGDKGFKPCDCNTRRQNDDREQSTKVSVVTLAMTLPPLPVLTFGGPIIGSRPLGDVNAEWVDRRNDPPLRPPAFA